MNLSTREWRQVKRIFEALLDVPQQQKPAALDSLCESVPHLRPVVQTMIEIHRGAGDQTIIPQTTAHIGDPDQHPLMKTVIIRMMMETQHITGMNQTRWQTLMASLGLSGAPEVFAALSQAYGEKHRHYHTAEHISAMFKHLDACKDQVTHPAELELAIWFHDAIYRPLSSTNEADSAAWAADFLQQQGYADAGIQRVHELIMATVHNGETKTTDQRWLVDIDLSILGTRPEVYAEYEQQVRREYRWVPGFVFRKKRAALLQTFLDQLPIYHTTFFQDRYEAAARANIQAAIEQLASS